MIFRKGLGKVHKDQLNIFKIAHNVHGVTIFLCKTLSKGLKFTTIFFVFAYTPPLLLYSIIVDQTQNTKEPNESLTKAWRGIVNKGDENFTHIPP